MKTYERINENEIKITKLAGINKVKLECIAIKNEIKSGFGYEVKEGYTHNVYYDNLSIISNQDKVVVNNMFGILK